jgi:KDO2-lipid IV(A) lauroyltransferase
MRWRKKLKRRATYQLVRFFFFLFNVVPRRLAIFVGAGIGLLAHRVAVRDRYKFLRHLSLAFGDQLSSNQAEAITRRFFVNSGKNIAEVLRFKKHYDREIKALVEVEGWHHFEAAHQRGKGIIGITGHLGNFELMAVHFAGAGYPVAVIGRDMYDSRLGEMLIENREAMGITNISTKDSPRRILKWLAEGKVLGALIDIDSISVRSEFVPALGRMALTPIGQSVIGLRTGAAFVPLACFRTEDNRYRIVIEPEVVIVPSGDSERDVIAMTAACTAAIDRLIRRYPDQWIWFKNRWLTAYSKKA